MSISPSPTIASSVKRPLKGALKEHHNEFFSIRLVNEGYAKKSFILPDLPVNSSEYEPD
jgi:hypothetical protein